MSWRLSPFHRLILDCLEGSRSGPLPDDSLFLKTAGRAPGWAKVQDVEVLLAEGVYDLHAVARCVRDRLQKGRSTGTGTGFPAAFSRGVRELIHAGGLQQLRVIPIVKSFPGKHARIKRTPDGLRLDCSDLRLRFVQRVERTARMTGPDLEAAQ